MTTQATVPIATPHITLDVDAAVAHIRFNRPEKRNAFTVEMLTGFCDALTEAEADDAVRCVLVSGEGQDCTSGLDFANVAPALLSGEQPISPTQVDPWDVVGRARTKPLIMAAQGRTWALGTEVALATDILIAAENVTFALREVRMGIFPFGGGMNRFIQRSGWGNAMRYLLTGDEFDVAEGMRLGLVQEVVPLGDELARATELAAHIASMPPLAVRAILSTCRFGQQEGWRAEATQTPLIVRPLFESEDSREAMMAFIEKRQPNFVGR